MTLDNTSFAHLNSFDLLAVALGEALVHLEAGDLTGVRVLLVECRLYLAEAVAADSTKH